MSENHPERNAWRMCDPESLSDHDQFAAIGEGDRWSERPAIKNERDDEYYSRTEQLHSRQTSLVEIVYVPVRFCGLHRTHGPIPRITILRALILKTAASHGPMVSQTRFPANP